MIITGIIPARYASSRFPAKPLIDIQGKSMIQRVYEQAAKCSELNEVIVATDDDRIYQHVRAFGGKAMMTSTDHLSGTDRCSEILQVLAKKPDAIINIQGDEPFINEGQISLVCEALKEGAFIATLVKKINTDEELFNPNIPKVILNKQSEAIYFSRETIPYLRNVPKEQWLNKHNYYKHIGLYGYTAEALKQISRLENSSLESAEMLEQLRWIENGLKIKVAVTQHETIAIDTPEDLDRLLKKLNSDNFLS